MSVIFSRRSVRDFLPKPVESEKIERILRAACAAPSAHNRQPWAFLVVTDKASREAIAGMSRWSKMCSKAAAVIACCADTSKGGSKAGAEDEFWPQDLAAATENALLQIAEEGLGGVWLGWYPDKGRVKVFSEYFKLPGHIVPVSLIALGYPAESAAASEAGSSSERFDPALVHYESW